MRDCSFIRLRSCATISNIRLNNLVKKEQDENEEEEVHLAIAALTSLEGNILDSLEIRAMLSLTDALGRYRSAVNRVFKLSYAKRL